MEVVTLQALRVKAALSISSPSKPLNAAIDGLVLTLVDHAALATIKIVAAAALPTRLLEAVRHLSRSLVESSGLPPEIGQQFAASGGFAIATIAVVVGGAAGVVRFRGWDFQLLRRLGATNRTGENLVWAETLTIIRALATHMHLWHAEMAHASSALWTRSLKRRATTKSFSATPRNSSPTGHCCQSRDRAFY